MYDRTQQGRDTAPPNRSVSSTTNLDGHAQSNGRRHTNGLDDGTDRSASAKPALTERERRERWPVD